jgi:DNA-binding Xre family transcriptional regulator
MEKTKLKQILEKRNMTQSELFYIIKDNCKSYLGKDVISRIVNGKKQNYEIYTLLKICMALNVTPNQIIEKENFVKTQIK